MSVVRTPSYRLHKPTGQAVVTLNGRDVYLGKHGSAESRAEFDRIVAEWLANGRQLPPAADSGKSDLAVNELVLAYLRWADGYYVKNDQPTKEPACIRAALKPLNMLYGHTPAKDFGPLRLKAVREAYIDSGLCRNEVNKRTRHIVRLMRWAVENELVPPSVHHGVKAVTGLRRGRSEARESVPVKPAPEAFVDAVKPFVSRQVWAIVELQRLTGMRSGEAVQMRTCNLDTSGKVWVYTPESHKTQHHGRERKIYLGPRAQAIVKPWLRTELDAPLFQPCEAIAEYRERVRRERKTKVQPSQHARAKDRKKRPKKPPGVSYSALSYGHAITQACKKAGVPHWHPHQLRHNAATRLRREHGLDVARIILGHASAAITETYAEVDHAKALEVMAQVG